MQPRSLILFAFALLAAAPAFADIEAAAEAFRAGRYDAAFEQAAAEPGADSHAFRARTLLAKAMCGEGEPSRTLIDKALAEANAALKAQPGHGEGRLQKAIALSLIIRPMEIGEARRTGYGEESKALAEAVLAEDPANFYAHGFLAVWHVEVERRGGMIGAAMMGASLKTARRHYDEAIRLSPEDIGLRWQWARALAALDAKKYRDDITEALQEATGSVPQSDLDRVMQGRAAELLRRADGLKPAQIEALARSMH